MSVPPKGSYSNLIVYDEENRYYVMQAQKNKPLLDAEVRSLNLNLLTLSRRFIQSIMGEIGSPLEPYSTPDASSGPNNAFKIIESTSNPSNNFTITGGAGLNDPAVLYYQGYYIFYKGNVEYEDQSDLLGSGETVQDALKRDNYTKTVIPSLTTPASNRTDVVYVDLSFAEVTALLASEYVDSSLRDAVVGTDTSNRLRAVFDIRTYEGWTGNTSADIYEDSFFGHIIEDQIDHYKFPIALIQREAGNAAVSNAMITDLLSLHDKRVYTAKEVSHRLRHGGWTQSDIDAGVTGAVLGEHADAVGRNEGIDTKAYNDDSVTPRVIASSAKFKFSSLLVRGDTGPETITDDSEALVDGEVVMGVALPTQIKVNHQDGITGSRGIVDLITADTRGQTGTAITIIAGPTGASAMKVSENGADPGLEVNSKGWLAINRGVTGPQVELDINGDGVFTGDLVVEKDIIVGEDILVDGYIIGDDFTIPANEISPSNPAVFGVAYPGLTGSTSDVHANDGFAAQGDNDLWGTFEGYGLTGPQGYSIGKGNVDPDGDAVFSMDMDPVGAPGFVFNGSKYEKTCVEGIQEVAFETEGANLFSFYEKTRFIEDVCFQGDGYFGNDIFIDGALHADGIDIGDMLATKLGIGTNSACSELDVWGNAIIACKLVVGTTPDPTLCAGTTTGTTTGTTVGTTICGPIPVTLPTFDPSDNTALAVYGDVQGQDFLALGADDGSYGIFAVEDQSGTMAAWFGGDAVSGTEVGMHLIDVDTFVFDKGAGTEDMTLQVNGSLCVRDTVYAQSKLAIGKDCGTETSLELEVEGSAQVTGTLLVGDLQFTGGGPVGGDEIPGNLSVIQGGTGTGNLPGGIQFKGFSLTQETALDGTDVSVDWATTTTSPLGSIAAPGDALDRVKLITLGNLKIEWYGQFTTAGTAPTATPEEAIVSYAVESPYFGVINWGAPRVDINKVISIEAGLIEDFRDNSYGNMFNINKVLHFFLQKERWSVERTIPSANVYTYGLKYELVDMDMDANITNFIHNYVEPVQAGTGSPTPKNEMFDLADNRWKLALMPKFQTAIQVPFGAGGDYTYQGEWDLDLVVFPDDSTQDRTISNLIGQLYLSAQV